ncbi:hypothetical protein CALVIDRAFT_526835 [Calocera viscosa TUFC12733]|uniref:Uncharacterized protein n=1 Tax=Calocera viscosa (strain TUFC12733) TaxID=1330018 RepID=A0A167N343_CALVF|nr:hypothetical protein CALVIDRAFT_526835 [Calocera viscosa TUFC12733]
MDDMELGVLGVVDQLVGGKVEEMMAEDVTEGPKWKMKTKTKNGSVLVGTGVTHSAYTKTTPKAVSLHNYEVNVAASSSQQQEDSQTSGNATTDGNTFWTPAKMSLVQRWYEAEGDGRKEEAAILRDQIGQVLSETGKDSISASANADILDRPQVDMTHHNSPSAAASSAATGLDNLPAYRTDTLPPPVTAHFTTRPPTTAEVHLVRRHHAHTVDTAEPALTEGPKPWPLGPRARYGFDAVKAVGSAIVWGVGWTCALFHCPNEVREWPWYWQAPYWVIALIGGILYLGSKSVEGVWFVAKMNPTFWSLFLSKFIYLLSFHC